MLCIDVVETYEVGLDESSARIEKVLVPRPTGVPEIVPVAVSRVTPSGSEPL